MDIFSLFSMFSRSSSGRRRHMHRRGSDYYQRKHRSSLGILGSLISSMLSRRSRSSSHRHHRRRSLFSSWS